MQIKNLIQAFLVDQYNKKSEVLRKKREKATDADEIAQLDQDLRELAEKYRFDNWIANAANSMAKQLKFGTHISKGIHPDSKGDNINFQSTTTLSDGLIGSQAISQLALDANGNAAALPLASFFNIIVDEVKNTKLLDYLLSDSPILEGAFANEPELSTQYKKAFQAALIGQLDTPTTHERNKQLFWANNEYAIENNDYTCLIPLYPSSLVHQVYQQINNIRYSEENKEARDNRRRNVEQQTAYRSLTSIATTSLGGSKPQNISQLTSAQGGISYLLPSLPPVLAGGALSIKAKQETIFNDRLTYICRFGLNQLYQAVEAVKNNYTVRDSRAESINIILQSLFNLVRREQRRTAGWTKGFALEINEQYWLDPKRAQLEDEEAFRLGREQGEWINEIERSFALWLNGRLKARFPHLRQEFNAPEYRTWRKAFRLKLRQELRRL